jgi:DNA-binding transcriptional MerR regulator
VANLEYLTKLLDFRICVRVYGSRVRAGEAARRAGVNVETLRYYERRGLLPEPARVPGGHRRYDEEAVRFLRAIKEAQAVGFTLAEIEEYLRVVRAGRTSAPEALRVRMAAKIDEIDARIAGCGGCAANWPGSSGARASR